MEKQQADWIGSRAGARPGEERGPEMERLRRDLDAYQSSAESWEAACLKSVADLLDSLDQARGEQDALSRRVADLHTDLETESEKRQRLKETLAELERKAERVSRLRAERDELLSSVESSAETLAASQAELEELRPKVATAEADRAEWNVALEKVRSGQAELEETRGRLTAMRKERDDLAAELRDYEAVDEARKKAEERAKTLRSQCDALNKRAEENLVEMCDLRVQLNRLENDRDDARRERRQKVKKILSKVHAALDEAGAPRGKDLSYGERIRWLKRQLES